MTKNFFDTECGIVVVEQGLEAESFAPNHFYATPLCGHSLRNMLQTIGSGNDWEDAAEESQPYENEEVGINNYTIDTEKPIPNLSKLKNLRHAVEQYKANVLLALYTPGRSERFFIVACISQTKPLSDLNLIVHTADYITRQCMIANLKSFAINDVESFVNTLHKSKPSINLIEKVSSFFSGGIFYGAQPSMSRIRKMMNIDGMITHLERCRALDNLEKHLVENIRQFKKNAITEEEKAARRKANAEIDLICNSIDAETLKRIFALMSHSQRERALKAIDPRETAKNSSLTISITHGQKAVIDSRTTDGYYRIVLHKDKQDTLLHFARRSSTIVYTIYLLDRHQHSEVDYLDLRLYKDLFVCLYEMFYHSRTEGEQKFKELWQHNGRRPQIHQCLNDIRQTIIDACRSLDEIATPYLLETEYSHLFVCQNKIHVPPEFIMLLQ